MINMEETIFGLEKNHDRFDFIWIYFKLIYSFKDK